MKFFNFTVFTFAAVLAISATGCGKNNDNNPLNQGGIVNAAPQVPVPVPPPVSGVNGIGSIPTGCYYLQPGAPCSPCPTGYVQSGNMCSPTNVGSNIPGCNGYTCNQPQGFGCPTGTSWSWQYYGCLSTQGSNVNMPGYNCSTIGYSMITVCRYTQNSPSPNYYFNGYGWVYY